MESDAHTTRVELILECAAESIRGAVLSGGTRREFAGWVELASAIELARSDAAVDPLGAMAERGGDR